MYLRLGFVSLLFRRHCEFSWFRNHKASRASPFLVGWTEVGEGSSATSGFTIIAEIKTRVQTKVLTRKVKLKAKYTWLKRNS